jgi:hypothetical protein
MNDEIAHVEHGVTSTLCDCGFGQAYHQNIGVRRRRTKGAEHLRSSLWVMYYQSNQELIDKTYVKRKR